MRHRIVEPNRIRRVCIEYKLNIMGLNLSSVATGQTIGWSLHILELITNSERDRSFEKILDLGSFPTRWRGSCQRNCKYRNVVESRTVNLKQCLHLRPGNRVAINTPVRPKKEKKKKTVKHSPDGAGGWILSDYQPDTLHSCNMTLDRVRLIVLLFKTRYITCLPDFPTRWRLHECCMHWCIQQGYW